MASKSIDVKLRLQGAGRFQQEASGASRSVRQIGDSASTAGRKTSDFSRNTSRMASVSQRSWGLIATGAKTGGLALAAAGGYAAKLGVDFNSTMEMNKVAFTQFLGSGERAEAMLGRLYKTAATTPFEFPQLVSAARRFLAFGFTAKRTESLLATVGDTTAGLGGGAEEIDRLSMALGQVQAKGKLSTEELLQMAELGVPAFQILKKEMGLTGEELESKLRQGAIKSGPAIKALQRGLNETFGGAAAKQAKTFTGQVSTLRDNMTQLFGKATKPLFEFLRTSALPALNGLVKGLMSGGKATGAFGKVLTFVKNVIADVRKIFRGTGDDFAIIGRALQKYGKFVLATWRRVLPGLRQIFSGLFTVVKGFVQVISGVLSGDFSKVWQGLKNIVGGALRAVWGTIRALTAPIREGLSRLGRPIAQMFARAWARARAIFRGGAKAILTVLRVLVAPARAAAGLIGRGIVAAFNVVRSIPGFIRNMFGKVVGFIRGLPGKIAGAASGMFDGLKEAFRSAINFIIRGWNSLDFRIPGFDPPGPGPKFGGVSVGVPNIPQLAMGGTAVSPGLSVVGERGPELRYMPQGASVIPLSPQLAAMGDNRDIVIHTHTHLNDRELAVSTERVKRKARARA